MATHLLSLPSEVLLAIFNAEPLHVKFAARARLVCRTIRDLLDNDITFQYRAQLSISNLQNGPPSFPQSTFERLKTLQEYQHAQEHQNFSWIADFVLDDAVLSWEISGGVLGFYRYVEGTNCFQFTRFPSKIRGIQTQNWSIPVARSSHAGPSVKDFTHDPSQDVLIYTSRSEPEESILFTISSLTDGSPHKDARVPTLHYTLEMGVDTVVQSPADISYLFQIHGRYFGAMIFRQRQLETWVFDRVLLIWDWRTGTLLKKVKDGEALESFCFLDNRYLLTLVIRNYVASLEVHYLLEDGIDTQVMIILHLPPIENRPSAACDAVMYVDTQPAHSRLPQVPFSTSYHDRIIMISLRFLDEEDEGVLSLAVYTPVSVLLRHAASILPITPKIIPWDAWGSSNAGGACVDPIRNFPDTWPCRTHGMRTIFSPRPPSLSPHVGLYHDDLFSRTYGIRDFGQLHYGIHNYLLPGEQEDVPEGQELERETDRRWQLQGQELALPHEYTAWGQTSPTKPWILLDLREVQISVDLGDHPEDDTYIVPCRSQYLATTLTHAAALFTVDDTEMELLWNHSVSWMILEDGVVAAGKMQTSPHGKIIDVLRVRTM